MRSFSKTEEYGSHVLSLSWAVSWPPICCFHYSTNYTKKCALKNLSTNIKSQTLIVRVLRYSFRLLFGEKNTAKKLMFVGLWFLFEGILMWGASLGAIHLPKPTPDPTSHKSRVFICFYFHGFGIYDDVKTSEGADPICFFCRIDRHHWNTFTKKINKESLRLLNTSYLPSFYLKRRRWKPNSLCIHSSRQREKGTDCFSTFADIPKQKCKKKHEIAKRKEVKMAGTTAHASISPLFATLFEKRNLENCQTTVPRLLVWKYTRPMSSFVLQQPSQLPMGSFWSFLAIRHFTENKTYVN